MGGEENNMALQQKKEKNCMKKIKIICALTNSDFVFGFKNAARATIPWLRPLPQRSVFFATSNNGRRRPGEGFGFSFRLGRQWGYHRVWIVRSPITFVDVLFVDLIFIFRCF